MQQSYIKKSEKKTRKRIAKIIIEEKEKFVVYFWNKERVNSGACMHDD